MPHPHFISAHLCSGDVEVWAQEGKKGGRRKILDGFLLLPRLSRQEEKKKKKKEGGEGQDRG